MSLSDLASVGSFVSGVAVLISLIYLALQVRQAEKNQRALIQQGRAARLVDIQLRLADPDLAAVYSRAMRGEELSAVEVVQFGHATRAIMVGLEDAFFQHRERLLTGPAFESVTQSLRTTMASPGRRAMWKLQRGLFEKDFQAYIDAIVRETPLSRPADDKTEWSAAVASELGSRAAGETPV